jgi:myo-inositol 2-dehydrogenase / D-chiro-inositol 1-dehydrogenase
VVEVIRRTGRPVQLVMRRYDPGYAAGKARIEAGELGRIEIFRALSRDTHPPPVEFLRHSGGIFLDMAVHDLDLARFLVGEVEEVHSWGANLLDARFAESNVIDTAVTMLRFENGALGVVETARHSEWGYDIRTELAGASGKVSSRPGRRRRPRSRATSASRATTSRTSRSFRDGLPSGAGGLHRGHP